MEHMWVGLRGGGLWQWDSLFFQSQEAGRNEKNAVRQYADRGSSSCMADCQRKGKSKGERQNISRKHQGGESWGARAKTAEEFLPTKIITPLWILPVHWVLVQLFSC